MYVNARAIIERQTSQGTEVIIQTRTKRHEGGMRLELPGGRVEEFESLLDALKREVLEETGLTLTTIEGVETRVEAQGAGTRVECLQPFAVYQTTEGPVDSMGVYFRCQAEGRLLETGDDAKNPQWLPVQRLAEWMAQEADRFSWVDRAGLLFYLKELGYEASAG